MKVFLLHRDRDFEMKPELDDAVFAAMLTGNPFALDRILREHAAATASTSHAVPGLDGVMTQDLELESLWDAMAGGDAFLFETAKRVTLSMLRSPNEILYRQQVLADCIAQPAVVRQLYALAMDALDNERQAGGFWGKDRPETTLYRSVRILELHLDVLKALRQVADEQADGFRSDGFIRFFAMIREELSDDYLHLVQQHLGELRFKHGLVESAALGKGDRGRDYVVRRAREQRWTERLPFGDRTPSFSFTIPPRDQAGFEALEQIRASGLNMVANSVAQAAEHIKSFFTMLRLELAFYLGCLNLHQRLEEKGEPTCFPQPRGTEQLALTARAIYDVCLSLHLRNRTVGNDVTADGKSLLVITGANQGGKSTLLRAIGLANVMMHSGMFVGAETARLSVCTGIYTHYKREEDATMEGGKLDEELARMSRIADEITPRSLLLCNESFAATNEREGSEIARYVVRAMIDRHIRVFLVTHMYDLAHGFHEQHLDSMLFLRAERQPDGRRTFRLREAEPLPTSYGEDSYRRIFATRRTAARVTP